MKTSNKILIGLISFLGICCFCFLIYAKSQVVKDNQRNAPQKSGYILKLNPDIFQTT